MEWLDSTCGTEGANKQEAHTRANKQEAHIRANKQEAYTRANKQEEHTPASLNKAAPARLDQNDSALQKLDQLVLKGLKHRVAQKYFCLANLPLGIGCPNVP